MSSSAPNPDGGLTLAALTLKQRWVAWREEPGKNGKQTKVPYCASNRKASSTEPKTWLAHDEAVRLAKDIANGSKEGAGIVLGQCGEHWLAGIDLDTCRDPTVGAFQPWAEEVMARLDSYAEVSPSGAGAKVFFLIAEPDVAAVRALLGGKDGAKWSRAHGKEHPPSIEFYMAGRYFTVTWQGVPTYSDGLRLVSLADLQWLVATGQAFAGKAQQASDGERGAASADTDDSILARLQRAAKRDRSIATAITNAGLMVGGSRSEGAMGLGAALKRVGWTFDEMVAALQVCPATRAWANEQQGADGARQFKRIWDNAKEEAADADGIRPKRKRKVRTADLTGFELNEDGIALAFANKHKDALRFDHTAGRWFRWTGDVWQRDETKLAFSWSRAICRQLAIEQKAEGREGDILAKAATAAAVERFAQADQALAVTHAVWNRDPWLLGVPGGTVDLRTGALLPAKPEDYITQQTAVAPAATADCPRWLQFLSEATKGDGELIDFLQSWCGYCLTGSTREHALLFIFGPGGNGKGVFNNLLTWTLGSYVVTAAMETFTATGNDRHPTDLAMLRGARLVCTSETEEGRSWAETRIKLMTGGDPITARFMRQDFFTYQPNFKLNIIGNHQPDLRNVDVAMRRRINMAPFLHKPAQPDKALEAALQEEGPGILRWMINGCLEWQRVGLVRPAVVTEATEEYFRSQDVFSRWIAESCTVEPNGSAAFSLLMESWNDYCRLHNEKVRSGKWIAKKLKDLGCEATPHLPGSNGVRGYLGISLRPNQPAM